MKILSLWSLLVCASLQAGTIVGTVSIPKNAQGERIAVEKYTGKISGKVSKPPRPVAGVWLTRKGLTAPKQTPTFVLNQKNYQFGASLIIVPKGATVSFPNEDVDHHNIYSLSRTKKFDLGRYKKNQNPTPEETFPKTGLVELHCEIHEHMKARLLVVDSPYYTATNSQGQFTLKNIPAGTYTLHAQLDKKLKWAIPVTVKTSGTTTIQLPR